MTSSISLPTAILGAGMMGSAIAAAHIRCGQSVVLYDVSDEALRMAPEKIARELHQQKISFTADLLTYTKSLDDVTACPIIIETINEKIKLKQKLYCALTENRKPDGFIFSNTSTISISELSGALPPEWRRRFCGLHFFHPVCERSVVEIVAGKLTDFATIEGAKKHASRIDKSCIIVGDSPGFLVNRILSQYLFGALKLLEEKVDLRRIERVAQEFGMQMGPFRIMDEIGLDVVMHGGWVLHKAFPERVPKSDILLDMVEKHRLGRKTGSGFMRYSDLTSWSDEGVPEPDFLVPEEQAEQNTISDAEIESRLFVPMCKEAMRCFEEGVITDLALADRASVGALGFPADTGGVVTWGLGAGHH